MPHSCPQAHTDGCAERTKAESEIATRSLSTVKATPSVFRDRATYNHHLVTIILTMNNLNFVPYCFLKSQLQIFYLSHHQLGNMRATTGLWCSSEPSVSKFSSPTKHSLEKEVSSLQAGRLNQLTGGSKPTEGVAHL